MSHKKKRLHYKKERVVLSDVLPYETPLIFSNRHFYRFLVKNKIEFKDSAIYWQDEKRKNSIEPIIKLIFGIEMNKPVYSIDSINKKLSIGEKERISIPFDFKISHKESEYRKLTICHPIDQLKVIDFYEQYKELMLYYCSLSYFSIRKPQRVAKFVFHKDKTHYDSKSDDHTGVEESKKEYENLRSFFVYKDYSNVHKFYESYKFHRCEKKYNKLLKLDISKCFDSIYTHSISWALVSKEIVKENIETSKKTFAGLFDKLMQQLNYNETNGIVIGPEFSRIFAELILQSVDRCLLMILEEKGIQHKVDYEVFRYVDDYFIFYNNDSTKNEILENLQHCLKNYKLHLNINKQVLYEKPIITEITIAKQRIKQLLNENLVFELVKLDSDAEEKYKGKIRINSNALITQFKIIVKECNVDYKDILNYTFSIIESKSNTILTNYLKSDENQALLIKNIVEILEFSFFIYAVSPRVNTTIKLCKILSIYFDFIKTREIKFNIDAFHKAVYDNICFILTKNKCREHTQIETVYLLLALSQLDKEYQLDEDMLCRYFGIEKKSGDFDCKTELNYFLICILIFYMKNNKKYLGLHEFIKKQIKNKFINNKTYKQRSTELVLLLMDSLSCPFFSTDFKKELLKIYGINDADIQENIIGYKQQWFINWKDFNFKYELDAKRSKEVY